jgi:hypothetical protein
LAAPVAERLSGSTRFPANKKGAYAMNQIGSFGPYPQAIRGAVARLSTSLTLGASPSLLAFLRFVVECVLAGETRSLKAYSIAVGALGQPPEFDPETNAIVRVTAGRLRRGLTRYYEGEGAADPVIIDIPRGAYVPRFSWRDTGSAEEAQKLLPLTAYQHVSLTIEEAAARREAIRVMIADLQAAIGVFRSNLVQSKGNLALAESGPFAATDPSEEA